MRVTALLVIVGVWCLDCGNAWAAESEKPEGGSERPDHNYQDILPKALPDGLENLVDDVKHVQVYKTAAGPKWSCWTRAWLTPQGKILVSFTDMSIGAPELAPSYSYEYAPAEKLKDNGIVRRRHWCESNDGGQTWKAVREMDISDPFTPQPDFTQPLDDGSTLVIGGVWNAWDYEKNTYINVGHTVAWRSPDGGITLSQPISLNDPEQMTSFCGGPKQLSDGTIVVAAYGTFDKKRPNPTTDAWLWFSEDRGKTWSKPLLIASGIATRTNDEPAVAELGNGDLLVVLRHANPQAEGAALYLNCGQIVVKRSESGWVAGEWRTTPMGFRGFPALLRTKDGVLICAGSGNQFNFSVDEGRTWSSTVTIADPAYNRHNHYPALLELPDGRILSVYHLGNHWPYPPPEEQWIHATSFRLKGLLRERGM